MGGSWMVRDRASASCSVQSCCLILRCIWMPEGGRYSRVIFSLSLLGGVLLGVVNLSPLVQCFALQAQPDTWLATL